MPNHMGGPVLWYASANKTIESHCRCPHDVFPRFHVVRVGFDGTAFFNQDFEQTFRETILDFGIDWVSQILLHHMHKRIAHAIHHLTLR